MTETPSMINCSFTSENALYAAYMPFVKGGGLFLRTSNILTLGTQVQLSVSLLTDAEPYSVDGKVVWITPKGAQDNKPTGVGVQFLGDSSRNLCNRIETHLAGMLKSAQVTDTI